MNRFSNFLLSGFVLLLSTLSAFAQPTLVLNNPTAPSESNGFIDVSVMDFTDITKMQFSINWNPGQLEFVGIKDIQTNAPLNLSMANIDISDVVNGILVFDWSKVAGATVADGMTFFSIEFKVLVPEGVSAAVVFSDTPMAINMNRSMSGDKNIYDPTDYPPINGSFTALRAIPDVFFDFVPQVPTDLYCIGDQVCYDLKVADFDSIVAMQFGITWDSSVITYDHIDNFGLLGFVTNTDTTRINGELKYDSLANVIWVAEDDDLIAGGASLPDGTTLFTLCFNITGEPDSETTIDIGNPGLSDLEIVNGDGEPRDLIVTSQTIKVTDCASLLTFSPDCNDAQLGDTVCVNLTATNFTDITSTKYTLTFDPAILEFVGTNNYNLPGLEESNFSVGGGVSTVNWSNATGQTINNGEALYALCFKAIGEIDSTAEINLVNLAGLTEITKTDGSILSPEKVQFNNCGIKILPPTIALEIPDESAPPDETLCLPVSVTNFFNINHIEMPIEWDPTVLEFVEVKTTGLSGLTINNFEQKDIAEGKLQLTSWDSADPNGLTLNDGNSIFELCFKIIGQLGEESPITFPNTIAKPVFIQNVSQDIESVPVNVTNGTITVAAGGLILASEAMEIKQNDPFCVDIKASNFNEIVSMDYGHIYDPAVLRFDSVNISGNLTGLKTTDIVATVPGKIKVIWFADGANGTSVAEETILYSLCFTAIGDLGSCANFTTDATQEITTVASAGTDVGIFNNLNDVCVDNFGLSLVNSLIPSCEGGDGSLEIAVSGDANDRFFYFLTKDNEAFLTNEDVENNLIVLENLDEGEYCLILSSINTGKSRNECFELRQSENNLPVIDLGADIDAGCIEATALISETLDGSNYTLPPATGGVIATVWTVLGEGNLEGPITDEIAIAIAPGTYIYTVTINQTKCAASDTIHIFTTQPPRIQVMPGGTIGCGDSTLQLGVEVLDENINNVFSWTTPDGHIIGDSTAREPFADAEGTYTLTVIDTANGCSGSDFTQVFLDTILPVSDAGPDLEMGCEDPFLQLVGTGPIGAEYVWTTADGSSIFYPDPSKRNIADVTRVGTYILTATNQINGCIARDTMEIIADESLPVARSSKDTAIIGCGAETVQLDGNGSSQGAVFAYRWEGPDNQFISDEDTILTTAPGRYNFIVVNVENNNCLSDTASIEVKVDRTEPVASITQSLSLDCKADCSPLTANVPQGDQYTYEWETNDGIICSGENTPTAMVQAIGVYKIIVTDITNNCSSTSSGIVGGDGTEIIADPGPSRQIDCNTEMVTLDGRGSTNTDNITYAWKNEAGETVSTEVTAEITEPGEYTLEIMDALNECRASGKVAVTMDKTPPLAEAGDAPMVTGCEFPTGRRLNGNGSESGANISYAWSSQAGIIVGDTTITAPEIGGPGTYVLMVTNRENGCSSTDQVTVLSDVVIPIVNAGIDKMLTCDEPTITLAGISEELPNNSMITWSTENGNIVSETDQLSIMVNAKGTYNLTIVSADGCTGSDEVVVDGDLELPEADAGIAQTITCNNALTINGSGTEGAAISILWTTSGGNILSGEDSFTPEVDRGGSYTLTVTNTDNNCIATSLVLITSEDDLPVANAGESQEICRNEGILAANLPEGDFIGTWSTLENSMIVDEQNPNSSIADLSEGANTYIWTLSNTTCGAFSNDTVVVSVPTFPIAANDAFEIQPSDPSIPLDVVANDQLNGVEYIVNIMEQPSTGQLTEVSSGVFEYSAPARYYGTQQFQYEICSSTCSELCDIANVRIVVLPGADVDTTNTLPNAITPNGDGLNDLLQFDELIFDALEFPKSELVIFNRWGNIVYQASPYNNDWNGTSDKGDELPEGTYYFVLRLDIAEGESMKGDVTILR